MDTAREQSESIVVEELVLCGLIGGKEMAFMHRLFVVGKL